MQKRLQDLWFSFRLWLTQRVLFRGQSLMIGCDVKGCTAIVGSGRITIVPFQGAAVMIPGGLRSAGAVLSDCHFQTDPTFRDCHGSSVQRLLLPSDEQLGSHMS
jgi:hypothetical protein